jgi:phage major head subunit gpT-like protein
MSAPVAVRNQFSHLFGSGALPVLEQLFMMEMERHPSRREQIFNVVSTDRDIYQTSAIHDLDLLNQISEGAEYTFRRPKQGASKTYTINKYGLGISISEEMVDDSKFDLIGDMVRKLARSAMESQEIQAMNVFNNGFSSELADDGLSVFNSAHTLPSGLTFRNQPSAAADLSVSSLETALSDFETIFTGDSGIIYNIKPKVLLVHPSQKRYAMELIGSELKADTADNNMNSLKQDGLVVVSSPHLTDTDAWFLLASPEETGLKIVQRKPIETKAAGPDQGFTTDSILYKTRYREAVGVDHAYGIYGNAGA